MTISKVSTVVSTHWLREHIMSAVRRTSKLTGSFRVLDTSWMPDPEINGYKQFYQEAHIPTALYFDLKKVSPVREGSTVKFPVPDSNFFEDYVGNLGISSDTHVIAYDRFNTRPSFRTWYLFRLFGHDKISILNGGLRQWLIDGFHVSTEEPVVEKGNFTARLRTKLLKDYQAMLKNVDTDTEQVMDARGSSSFYDTEKDVQGGHIPNSKNIPFGSLFYEDGTVKSVTDLRKLFTEAGIDLNKPVVSTCQTGMTACGLIAAAYMLGKEDVPLYNGSFHEWNQLAESSKIIRKSS